jgi:hypothetical protein
MVGYILITGKGAYFGEPWPATWDIIGGLIITEARKY